MKLFTRIKIKFIRILRRYSFLAEPKRRYTYNGKVYPFYKAPLHSTIEGDLFIDDNELLNSVMFHKTLKQALDSSISSRLKKHINSNQESKCVSYCNCASDAMKSGANRDVVDGYEDNCPLRNNGK